MISISSVTGSTEGIFFEEDNDSELDNIPTRISKAKTLDGDVSIEHRGICAGDRELRIKVSNYTAEIADALKNIQKNETFVNLSCRSGFFYGAIESLSIVDVISIIFWVKEDKTV